MVNRKRFIGTVMVLFIMLSLLYLSAITVSAADVGYEVTGGKIYFDPATGTVTGCEEGVTEATIPSEIYGVSVNAIGDRAFYGKTNLKSITIPNGVVSIGGYAFFKCDGLTSISIPSSVITINSDAFSKCVNLENVSLTDGLVSIYGGAFSYCESLQSITIPDSVTIMEYYAFHSCTSLTTAIIGNGITYIPNSAFNGCTSLVNLTLPNSLKTISVLAFEDCVSLKSLTIPDSVTTFEYSGQFEKCRNLTYVYIGDGLSEISDSAFWSCTGLERVRIGKSVAKIGDSAFGRCGITSIFIPKSVSEISRSAFNDCTNLRDVYYEGSVSDWALIKLDTHNDALASANIHFNSTGLPEETIIPTLPVSPATPSFSDVASDAWYSNDVKGAYETGLINGFEDNTFRPESYMTYAQAVKLAACMNQKYNTGSVTLVNGAKNWWDSYVDYAKRNNIINKDYDWSSNATRAGYVEIFAKALPDEALEARNTIADGSIPDVTMSHSQATEIYKMYRAGILTGMDDKGTFQPDSNIKRSEVSAILTRMMNENARKELTLTSPFEQQYWVIFTEGYRDNRVEASTVDSTLPSDQLRIIWNKKLELNNSSGSGKYDQYYLDSNKQWNKLGDYERFSENATSILASNLDIYDKDGYLISKKISYEDIDWNKIDTLR